METNKPLARAGYLLAAALIIIPLFDATTSVWPLHFGDERWRFGAVGTLSNVTLVPLLGLLLALAAATLADNRRTRRFIGWICAIFAAIIAALAVLFILDYFQVRTTVVPKFQHATSVASATALVKDVVTIGILLLLSRAGFAGPKVVASRKQVRTTESTPSTLIPLGGTRAAPVE